MLTHGINVFAPPQFVGNWITCHIDQEVVPRSKNPHRVLNSHKRGTVTFIASSHTISIHPCTSGHVADAHIPVKAHEVNVHPVTSLNLIKPETGIADQAVVGADVIESHAHRKYQDIHH